MAPLQTARTSEELMASPDGSKLYAVMGGDSTFFTGVPLAQSVEIYDVATNTWSYGNPVVQKAAAPSGGLAGGKLMVEGGVDGTTYLNNVQVSNLTGGGTCPTPSPSGSPTPSPTPSASPSPSPSPTCVPSAWSAGSPYPVPISRYAFAQTGTHFYVFGGVSNGSRVNNVNRMDIATGVWQSRAPMPFTSEAPTCALMAATGIVYCAEGDTGPGFASYNTATDTWTPLTGPGGDHYGAASGAFNGKVFLAGGSTTITNTVQVYDVAANTWSTGTAAPSAFLLAGYQQVGQFLYVVGGFTAAPRPGEQIGQFSSVLYNGEVPNELDANNATTWRLDLSSAPGVWTAGPAFTPNRADFGLAYDPGTNKLYALGGDLTG